MLNTEEAYKTVIDILISYSDTQKLELFHYIAKNYPDSMADSAMEMYGGIVSGEKVSAEIIEYLRQNKKINAIKVYRSTSGMGLKESKDFIDEVDRDLRRRGII